MTIEEFIIARCTYRVDEDIARLEKERKEIAKAIPQMKQTIELFMEGSINPIITNPENKGVLPRIFKGHYKDKKVVLVVDWELLEIQIIPVSSTDDIGRGAGASVILKFPKR